MRVAPTMDPAAEYVAVLRAFGLSPADLDESVEVSDLSPGTIATELGASIPAKLHAHLRTTLARSSRGIEAPREYWSEAPCFQLSDAFEPYGHEIELTPANPGWEVETFVIELRDGDDVRRARFTYPDSELGTDNYPALIHAVESRLLSDTGLTFVRLADHEDDERWRFVLVERDRLAELRAERGDRVDVFDRPLLARRQPEDFVTEEMQVDDPVSAGTAVSASEFEAVFDTIDPAAGTGQSAPAAETVTGERPPAPVDGEGAAAPDEWDTTADVDEGGDTADDGDPDGGFEWLSDVESAEDDEQTGEEHRPWADDRSGDEEGDAAAGRLSDEIATILYPDRSPTTSDRRSEPTSPLSASDHGGVRRGSTDGGFDADARTEGNSGVAFPEMTREFRDVELDEEWEPPHEASEDPGRP